MAVNPREMNSDDYYELLDQMSPSELVDQRRAMRARIADQNGRMFSSEAPYFITSFDRLRDALDWGDINSRIDKIQLPERKSIPGEKLDRKDLNILLDDLMRSRRMIPTRGGRR